MTPKTTKNIYWITTLLFALMMFMDGIGGVTQQEAGQEVMIHLGYPLYFLIIAGIAKLLGVVAIVQTKFKVIKEWAYAGFAFNFIGAFASRAFLHDGIFETIFPLIILGILFVPYSFWKKYETLNN